ncbi:MAG: hypothetical protein AVDCRST_MAG74-216 [uncultured Pyrinomonadaceae bacterium]|uniref:Uncharacterized protein n=1 Tax=uncultured Pyrinomonadaceae bacterium TaxID=2283094 RepID=A0A6J4N6B3_9BACT|nr:MAG: hypothetical protein AVDCRST_MAG74-216 [uncultured Pyrinomonadaceae bacterium]
MNESEEKIVSIKKSFTRLFGSGKRTARFWNPTAKTKI